MSYCAVSVIMRAIFIIIAQIIFLVSIHGSTRNIFFEDNEITNRSINFITMKFPEMDEILLKHPKMSKKPRSSTMVVPVQGRLIHYFLNYRTKKRFCRKLSYEVISIGSQIAEKKSEVQTKGHNCGFTFVNWRNCKFTNNYYSYAFLLF